MKIKFHKIENMICTPARMFGHQAVRYDCDASFSSPDVAGDVFLRIYELLRWTGHPEVVLDRELRVDLSLEAETEITDLESTDAFPESIRPLGPRGHFEIIAHLVEDETLP